MLELCAAARTPINDDDRQVILTSEGKRRATLLALDREAPVWPPARER